MNKDNCKYCKNEINEGATICPHCKKDLRSWWRRHYIITFLLIVGFGIPIISTMIDVVKDDLTSMNETTSTLTLTEELKKDVDDPYWTSNKVEDYSDLDKILIAENLFKVYANTVYRGETSSSTEDNNLAKDLKQKLINKQVKEFPKLRKAYAEYLDKKLWEQDINVTSLGTGNTSITLVGSIFASNKGIGTIHLKIQDILTDLRFKKANYKWYAEVDNYQYYDIESKKDSDLVRP